MTMEHIKRSFQVTLAIRHPSIDPTVLSTVLALSPSRQSKIGEQKVTPSGQRLEGTYQFSSWGHKFDTNNITDLSEFLPSVVSRLKCHASYFSELVREGGHVELFCGIFADGNWDENFHHTFLSELAALSIDLRLDVYPMPDETNV